MRFKGAMTSSTRSPTTLALKATWGDADGTLLTDYSWSAVGDTAPINGEQWALISPDVDVQALSNGAYKISGGKLTGRDAGSTDSGYPTAVAAYITLPSPATKIITTIRNTNTSKKSDIQVFLRGDHTKLGGTSDRVGSYTHNDWSYVPCQFLMESKAKNGTSPFYGLLHVWGDDYQGQLLKQVRLNTDTSWAAGVAVVPVEEGYGNSLTGHTVKPTTPNGYIYNCVVGGTTVGPEPSWPTTVGDLTTPDANGVQWQCLKEYDWQTQQLPIEIIDNGAFITVSLDGDTPIVVGPVGCNQMFKEVGIRTYHDSDDSFYGDFEVWI